MISDTKSISDWWQVHQAAHVLQGLTPACLVTVLHWSRQPWL